MRHYTGFYVVCLCVAMLCAGLAPAWGATLYVNASATGASTGKSWTNAFTDLQAALNNAVAGDQIWVAAGTYTPNETIGGASDPRRAAFLLKSEVQVYGGFAGDEKQLHKRQLDPSVTVLSGDIGTAGSDGDNCYHVVYASGVTGVVLDGFTVTGGRGDGGKNYTDYQGAGMHTTNSVLTVANCAFMDNKVGVTTGYIFVQGGGMYNVNSAPTVTNCTFTANQAGNRANMTNGTGGGMYNEGVYGSYPDLQSPVITGCTFSNNLASSKRSPQYGGGGGGGMANSQCSATVDRCTFTENMAGCGGGMLNYLAERPTITNCVFDRNTSHYMEGSGGAIYNFARATIINCTFYRNGWRQVSTGPEPRLRPYTAQGGAIYDERVGSLLTNCLFSENAVNADGGAIYSSATVRAPTTLTNCLFYQNIQWWPNDGDPVIEHIIGSPLSPDSVGNLFDIDPLLTDPAGGDFHLRFDSPCIDAGTTLKFATIRWMPVPAKDYEGDQRFVDADGDDEPAADIGVDEFIPDLPALRAVLMALVASSELDAATVARLLAYVDDAQAALDRGAKDTAIQILNALIADVRASLGETETAQRIIRMTEAIIEHLD